ncbi:uncharacterized protein B0J16DRAFT_330330 [Fusarium flagelliforme]|uniref:uncharacterized protein n=1 Tax=Fusarium flagelliforme TaxID=2675880 RepID=UPI001E8E5384|nr:uncharacterized protein B0J16DRAFT_330330 [Fusarium flagelliforme]KAH7198401.1 hypothetical protein B0J16DRAFT_330330 [Fusarium flagelliforme]
MAITISALPTEILDKVIHLVVDGENLRSAIIPCLFVNRKWKDVSLAILYGDLVLFCGTPLSRFLACHDRQAIANLTRSFTFYLSQAEAPDSSTYDQVLLSTRQLIEDVIPLMNSLKSFSLKRQHRLRNVWTTKSTISLLLNSLPVSCTSLELDAIPHDGDNPTHVCEDLRRLLPRMEHIHVDLEPICDAMLGTWDVDETFHPISLPQMQSLHISCAGNDISGIRGCVERHQEARPLSVSHSMVQALQQVMELQDTASSEVTILGSSPRGHDNTALCWTLLRCHMRKEPHGVRTETWAYPNSWLLGDIHNPAWYIRMKHEAYVARERDNIIVVAGGRPWRTLITGTRLPKGLVRGKEFMPDDGLFDHKDWTKMHPKKQPCLIFNERKAGMSLIEAELHEGYEERSLLEYTPKGFVRYGGPVWQNTRLYAEDDEPPEDWDPDGPNGAVG